MTDELPPISALFFDDPGPHVVRAGFPSGPARAAYTPARGQELRALLTTSITQLGAVSGEIRRKTPIPLPPPVAIDTLLYSGRAALDRALAVREEILAAGTPHDTPAVQELLDLIILASAD
ncbi:MAG: hypothetical protein ACR2GK_12055 [Gemmatimonadaceae bacterium]